jgi:hypothetical protein
LITENQLRKQSIIKSNIILIELLFYIYDKKSALDYTKLIDIFNIDDIPDVQYEIVITMLECISRIINIFKTYQYLEVIPEMRNFMTKDNKTIENYPSKVINSNNKIFTDNINKKKEYLFGSTVDQNEYEEIEFSEINYNIQFQKRFNFIINDMQRKTIMNMVHLMRN